MGIREVWRICGTMFVTGRFIGLRRRQMKIRRLCELPASFYVRLAECRC